MLFVIIKGDGDDYMNIFIKSFPDRHYVDPQACQESIVPVQIFEFVRDGGHNA